MSKRSPKPVAASYILVSNGDDWEGLYVNGKLVQQDHSLSARDVLSLIGIDIEQRWVSYDYTAERGNLPDKLADIPAGEFHD